MIYFFLILFVLIVISTLYLNHPKFGRSPHGERLARMQSSPNYKNGKFHNQHITPQFTSEKSKLSVMLDFFKKEPQNRPTNDLPTINTDLKNLESSKNVLVWFGHSSYFLQNSGKNFLVDPVFEQASPVSFFNKPFKGTDVYKAENMPNIDYLIITHDHWDHLDYTTIKKLKDKVQKIICPLGVGEYFEYWGFHKNQIMELDWNESISPEKNITFHCFPTRHFSGRRFSFNNTLWASFMLQTPQSTIYIGGDSGYDTHFAQIAQQFPKIDIAIIENGQYNKNWKYIHLIPEDLVRALKDLNAKKVFTFHNSKYALSKHSWKEPLDNIFPFADSLNVIMPKIGEVVYLDEPTTIKKWWANIE